MAAPAATSLVPRAPLAPRPRPRPAAASPSGPAFPGRGNSGIRLRHTPVGTAAASSPSVPSPSPDSGQGIGDALGGVEIYSAATGEPVLFRDLWDQNEGMAVVALLRHFGCPCCWELASVLRDTKDKFDSAGVKLIAVGVGTPAKARILAERLPFPLEYLYADPERKAYDLLGLCFGVGRTFFNPASVKVFSRFDSLKEAVKNYTIEATPDDRAGVLQQGGCLCSKVKNCYMQGKMRAQVITHLWMTYSTFAAKFQSPDGTSYSSVGWLLSAYFLGGFGDDAKGRGGVGNAVIVAAKSWAVGIPLGLAIRAVTSGHIPPTPFILVTMGSTGVLLTAWRALVSQLLSTGQKQQDDVYRRGSPFELFELLTSLVRRW